ncbi:DUF3141 domain-containing protein, partial [Teichococcus oryzae]
QLQWFIGAVTAHDPLKSCPDQSTGAGQPGNAFLEREDGPMRHVLTFEFDVVMEGRDLPQPLIYWPSCIKPPADAPLTDPGARPFIIMDPRAGHGPGIGGFKEGSEIVVLTGAGHPRYFVGFRPASEPG